MQEGFPRDLGYRLHRQKDRKPACLLAFCLSAQWIEYGKCHALLTLILFKRGICHSQLNPFGVTCLAWRIGHDNSSKRRIFQERVRGDPE